MKYKNKKGFTLVEIMIVVVIIGLLTALAIPAFQKVRNRSITSTVENDARQLGHAAQQYFLENNATTVLTADLVGTETDKYLKDLSDGVTAEASITQGSNFTVTHPQLTAPLEFDDEGD
jgi:type IV pilus assembly protein PilA